jgi:hypothetical protein
MRDTLHPGEDEITDLMLNVARVRGLLVLSRALASLAGTVSGTRCVMITAVLGEYTVTATGIDGKRVSCTSDDLAAALSGVGGDAPTKRCQGPCGLVKPLDQFSRHAASRDGRWRRCKQCERQRVKEHDERRKSKAQAGQAGHPAPGRPFARGALAPPARRPA